MNEGIKRFFYLNWKGTEKCYLDLWSSVYNIKTKMIPFVPLL